MERALNPRKQGDVGMGRAIAWFASNGYTVCIPLTDSQPYDLVVDKKNTLSRVSVKTTTSREGPCWVAGLRTSGSNTRRTTRKHFDTSEVDLLFVVCGDDAEYVIPTTEIRSKASISLGGGYRKYEAFCVTQADVM